MLGRSEHVRKLDVGPKDQSTYRQKASCREFRYQAKRSNIAPRRSKVAGVNIPIGQFVERENDAPKDRTKRWKNQ